MSVDAAPDAARRNLAHSQARNRKGEHLDTERLV